MTDRAMTQEPEKMVERYGIQWNGPDQPVCVPMADGYWTPWHIAADLIDRFSHTPIADGEAGELVVGAGYPTLLGAAQVALVALGAVYHDWDGEPEDMVPVQDAMSILQQAIDQAALQPRISREDVARIIDPEVWANRDLDAERRAEWESDIRHGWGDVTFEQWVERGTERSLAKADAIIAGGGR